MTALMYKVVLPSWKGDFYYSCSPASNSLNYVVGEKTVPVFGKIFCFKSLKDAEDFMGTSGIVILIGEAENPKGIRMVSGNPDRDNLFWIQYKNKKSKASISILPAPKGSFVADSFTPIQKYE